MPLLADRAVIAPGHPGLDHALALVFNAGSPLPFEVAVVVSGAPSPYAAFCAEWHATPRFGRLFNVIGFAYPPSHPAHEAARAADRRALYEASYDRQGRAGTTWDLYIAASSAAIRAVVPCPTLDQLAVAERRRLRREPQRRLYQPRGSTR